MSLLRRHIATAVALAACLGAGAVGAQGDLPVPAEAPPAGFAPDEYVDSAGCAFLRVGVGTSILWAPRYGPGGEQLCGLRPSLSGQPARTATTEGPSQDAVSGPADSATQPAVAANSRKARGFEAAGYYVQAGAFGLPANATRVEASFAKRGWNTQSRQAGRLTLIYAGPFADPEAASAALRLVRREGMPDAFILRQE